MPAILHDKFYTPLPIVRKCVGALWRALGMRPDDLFVEPSAGAGAFCRHLPQNRLMALDIAPEAEGIATGDFLAFEPPAHEGRVVVIGNPPFGRNGAMARAFLRHAMGFADIVAFILPVSFAKPSMQRGIDQRFHLIHETQLGDQHFETSEGDHVVNTVFQIWQKRDVPRQIETDPVAHVDFTFVANIHDADLVIRRVGGRAGAVLDRPIATEDGTLPPGYSRSSNYFIKAVGCDPGTLEERLRSLDLSRPAGIAVYPSLSKRELIGAYIEVTEPKVAVRVTARSSQEPRPMVPSQRHGLQGHSVKVIVGWPANQSALVDPACGGRVHLEMAPPSRRPPGRGRISKISEASAADILRRHSPAPGAAHSEGRSRAEQRGHQATSAPGLRGPVRPPAATAAICNSAQDPKAGTPASKTRVMKRAAARASAPSRCIWMGEPINRPDTYERFPKSCQILNCEQQPTHTKGP